MCIFNILIATIATFNNMQGVSFENWKFQMAITLKLSTFDHMLVKPKCILEVVENPLKM